MENNIDKHINGMSHRYDTYVLYSSKYNYSYPPDGMFSAEIKKIYLINSSLKIPQYSNFGFLCSLYVVHPVYFLCCLNFHVFCII